MAAGEAPESHASWAPTDIRVVASVPGAENGVSTRFEVGHDGDARISINRHDSAHTHGTILLVGGRWMLSAGFAPTPGKEIEALDSAALNSQLVIVLLTAALPKGAPPAGVSQHVHLTETNNPIRIATETAAAEYDAPWTVDGTVGAPAVEGPVSYHLSLSWSAQGHPTTRVFAGTASEAAPTLSIPDSTKLAGWSVRAIGTRQGPASAGGAGPAGAAAGVPAGVTTVGELRRLP